MAGRALIQRLESVSSAALDSVIFIYQFQEHPVYSHLTRPLFAAIQSARVSALASVLVLSEVMVGPLRMGKVSLARQYQRDITLFPNLSLLEISQEIAARAAHLRAQFNISTPDALHISTALEAGAPIFVTNDRALRRVTNLEIIVLEDFVS